MQKPTPKRKVEDTSGYLFGVTYSIGVLQIAEAVEKNLERLDRLSSGSATELRKSAENYRNTERKNAKEIDRIYGAL